MKRVPRLVSTGYPEMSSPQHKGHHMADIDEFTDGNSVILRLMELILSMNDAQRLDLLSKMEELPIADLSLGDRNDVRKAFDKHISFTVQERAYKALCRDISSGGLFIQTEEMFSLGQIVMLNIPFSDGSRMIKIPAEIVRINDHGIGLRFMKKENELL